MYPTLDDLSRARTIGKSPALSASYGKRNFGIVRRTANADRNQQLIDCYLSEQISPRQWEQHLINDPGLHDAWDVHLARYGTVDQVAAAQRRLSPKFPTIDEANKRRARAHERVALSVFCLAVIIIVWSMV